MGVFCCVLLCLTTLSLSCSSNTNAGLLTNPATVTDTVGDGRQPMVVEFQTLPLVGYHSIPHSETSLERYSELAATGLNISMSGFPNVSEALKALDYAKQVGVKLIVSCPELASATAGTVRTLMEHEALAGYFLKDEPSANEYKKLGAWVQEIRAVDKDHVCYFNLFPTYAPMEHLGVEAPTMAMAYREYVRRSLEEVQAGLLSFDHYPIITSDGVSVREDWYENLEIIASEAKRSAVPFWAFALTVAHGPYPKPSLAHLRLQVYSNLAYGAQGIQYFTYWTPTEDKSWDFNNAPIDGDGNRTAIYDIMSEMNRELQKIADVFLGSNVLAVGHLGALPVGTDRLSSLPDPFKKINTSGSILVSILENEGVNYLVMVNKDLHKSADITLELAAQINRLNEEGIPMPVGKGVDAVDLAAGNAVIYSWRVNK